MRSFFSFFLCLVIHGIQLVAQEREVDTLSFYTMLEVQIEEQQCNAFIQCTSQYVKVDLSCSKCINFFYPQRLYSSGVAKLADQRLIRIKPGVYTLLPLENGYYRMVEPVLQRMDTLQNSLIKQ